MMITTHLDTLLLLDEVFDGAIDCVATCSGIFEVMVNTVELNYTDDLNVAGDGVVANVPVVVHGADSAEVDVVDYTG